MKGILKRSVHRFQALALAMVAALASSSPLMSLSPVFRVRGCLVGMS